MLYFKKIYQKINWKNKKSGGTPINEVNLGKMDNALDNLDDEMVLAGALLDDLESSVYKKSETYNREEVYTKSEADNKFVTTEYELPKATGSTLGGIKVGANLSVTDDGTLSADAQQVEVATTTKAGIVKVGNNLTITEDGTLSATGGGISELPIATETTLGGVMVGDGLKIDDDGVLSVKDESEDVFGEFIPVLKQNVSTTDGVASLAQTPYGGHEAWYAFDKNDTTFACGATSGDSIDLFYERTEVCKPTNFYIYAGNSGNRLRIYGFNSDGSKDLLSDTTISAPNRYSYDVTTDKYYNKFEFYVTGGSSMSTPCIYTAQVTGYVKVPKKENERELTQAEYDALPDSKNSDNVNYFIKDASILPNASMVEYLNGSVKDFLDNLHVESTTKTSEVLYNEAPVLVFNLSYGVISSGINGLIITFKSSANYGRQIGVPMTNNNVMTRNYANGTFSAWANL